LFLIEIFTPSFFAASLGIGAFASAIAAYFGVSLEVQMLLFSIVSVLSIFILRPIIKKRMYDGVDVKTNADALIGKIGTVISAINPNTNQGRCAIDGDEWQFVLENELDEVSPGKKVQVTQRDSIILTVKPIKS
jgi:membrane protein implicated in regulation of membrane protease activity